MRIEAGKYYKTRDGRKVGPAEPVRVSEFNGFGWNVPWPQGYFEYNDEGKSCLNYLDDDLIAEWTDTPTGPVRERVVTTREIVPGTYGIVRVLEKPCNPFPRCINLRIDHGLSSATELRAAAATLLELAGALE